MTDQATVRLYQTDSYAKEFQARILSASKHDTRLEVVLDRTIFYPTAGGQAHDLGTLGGFRVVEVQGGKNDSTIVHMVEATPIVVEGHTLHAHEVLEPGQTVRGRIDWARRFDLMQQHTGEHILGQAFFRLGAHVVAVNMEREVCTLDLDRNVEESTVQAAELAANQAIWQGHEIACYDVPEDQIEQVPLRRTPKVSGLIRVVQIGVYDHSACGGTHLRNSSEVGMLKILKLERVKGGLTRVHFICGERCWRDYGFKHEFVSKLGLRFSTAHENVPAQTEAMLEEWQESKRQLAALRAKHAQLLAGNLAASTPSGVVLHVLEDPLLLPELAKAFAQQANTIGLLAAQGTEKTLLSVTCGPGSHRQANTLLKLGLEHLGGKGGGSADIAQGSAAPNDRLGAALELMRRHALEGA